MKCFECRFWNWNDTIEGDLTRTAVTFTQCDCRRNAPVIEFKPGLGNGETVWPQTGSIDFCGDFAWHPVMEWCKTCDQRVGKERLEAPGFSYAVQYPICRTCYDQFVGGTHPYLKPK